MEKVKINLGCGISQLKGFINVDSGDFDGDYIKADVRELPFEDEYADYILARQVLEHIPFREIIPTLLEWFRVLKPGGRMVVTCPDFDWLAEQWTKEEFSIETWDELAQGIYGNQLHDGERHQVPITKDFLEFCLERFEIEGKVTRYPAGHPMVAYPGIPKDKDKIYRYGEVHVDLKK